MLPAEGAEEAAEKGNTRVYVSQSSPALCRELPLLGRGQLQAQGALTTDAGPGTEVTHRGSLP